MSKKTKIEKIIETEPVVIDKEAIVDSTEIKEDEVIEVETEVELKILIGFTDKYTGVDYKIGDVISFKTERVKELLDDPRGLVEKIV